MANDREEAALHTDAEGSRTLRTSVVVPTYGRPQELMKCIAGLKAQTLQPLEILIVVRRDDHATREALASYADARCDVVGVDGYFVAALNAGIAKARGEIIAFTDDDAIPRPDWVAGIESHFARDPALGGLGGRDLQPRLDGPPASVVGRIAPYGRLVGNHHQGAPAADEVDILKGVNMSFRAAALGDLRFDDRLAGVGVQMNSEVGICLAVKKRGWKIVYDPNLLVDHYPGFRAAGDVRRAANLADIRNESHNEVLGLATGLTSLRRVVTLAYQLAVGTRRTPGPLLALEGLIVHGEGRWALRRARAATGGRLQALSTIRGQRLPTS